MDWQAEADALMGDIKPYVIQVAVSKKMESSVMKIYLEIETLENEKLTVAMDSDGFSICDNKHSVTTTMEGEDLTDTRSEDLKIYETINALLDDISPRYREAFAKALIDKVGTLGESYDSN